jgi:uncharacterized protein YkwD
MALPFSPVRGGSALAGAVLIALSLSAPTAGAAAACKNASLAPDGHNGAQLEAAVFCLLNKERAKRGLGKLKQNGKLLEAAERHSDDMVAQHYFDHTSPTGDTMKDRAVAARYIPQHGTWRVAENIAWGQGSLGSPKKIVASWMKSPPHRANILDGGLRHVGVGVAGAAPAGGDGATFTLVLGVRS